jgi:cystathionine beta-lyase/cystathionine gamma-synthase
MERQTATACDLARWLEEQPWVERVHYPGLPSHANYELSRRQFDDRFPAILAFDLTTDEPGAIRFINNLRLITSGTSLGDVASLVLYPSRTSHRGLTAAELRAIGIGPGLIRLAVGLESPADLKRDLEAAALSLG